MRYQQAPVWEEQALPFFRVEVPGQQVELGTSVWDSGPECGLGWGEYGGGVGVSEVD